MKIVIFIDWFAPAYKAGGPIQSIVNLVNQKMEGIEYEIVCSNKDLDGQVLQGIEFDQWVPYNAQTRVWYNSRGKNLFGLLKEIDRSKPDIFFINGIYSFYYNFLPIFFGKSAKKIISARGMLHKGALTQKSFKKKVYLQVWKMLNIHRNNYFHATNKDEEKFIKAIFGDRTSVHVAPNLPRILQTIPHPKKIKDHLELISIGLISPMKNYLEVIKALANCKMEISYRIYGPIKDHGYWEECNAVIKILPANIQINYCGDLPSVKVQEALNKAHVFVLPSKSENFGHAIFEALTAGKPVITSHGTPWNNLQEAKAGFNISPENNYELSKAICFFARADEQELSNWSASAKDYAARSIDIERIKSQYQKMFST